MIEIRPGTTGTIRNTSSQMHLIYILLLLCPFLALCADFTLTREQIESDYLNPESLRQVAGTVEKELGKQTREQDAAGGCDGLIDGKWGFHTENEDHPWWQVDLGAE